MAAKYQGRRQTQSADGGYLVGWVRVTYQTDAAIQVDLGDGDRLWVPKSAIHLMSEVLKPYDEGDLWVESWFARRIGL